MTAPMAVSKVTFPTPAFGSFSTYLSVVLYERRMRAVLTYIGAPARSRAGA